MVSGTINIYIYVYMYIRLCVYTLMRHTLNDIFFLFDLGVTWRWLLCPLEGLPLIVPEGSPGATDVTVRAGRDGPGRRHALGCLWKHLFSCLVRDLELPPF